MKYLLSITLLISCACFGQVEKWDSTKLVYYIDSTGVIPADVDLTPLHLSLFNIQKDTVQYDTVKTMMVICDTSRVKYGEHFITDSIQTDATGFRGHWEPLYTEPNHDIYWQIGYEVRTKQWVCCDPSFRDLAAYYWSYSHVKYLDADKKELSKNIIVWMLKELK